MIDAEQLVWHRIADVDALADGRVMTVAAGRVSLALTRFNDRYGALDNHCPHQGGPLGEGSIEKGWLRCPWHGYDYDPITGTPPPGFTDAPASHPVEVRADGVYVGLAPEQPRATTVSDLMVETMSAWGVTHVFGMVGHSNLGFADAMRAAEVRGDLTFIGIRHEGAAAFAASAYGNLTGVHRDSDHVELVNLACKHALAQRGVAHLVLPDEVQALPAAPDARPGGPSGRVADLSVAPADGPIEQASALIAGAKRPVIVLGHGARKGIDDVVRLAEHVNAPILTTFKAKGIVADDHPLACGVLGRSGTPVASWHMNESDLLIVFGASFANHTGIASYKPIIQVDSDPDAIGRFHAVTVPLFGDIGVTARRLLDDASRVSVQTNDQRDDVASRKAIWHAEKKRRALDDNGRGVASAPLFEALTRHTPENAVIAVDVGNNTYSFGRYFECKPGQHVLMSGYLGSIGFGFPAAMGAWAAAPTRTIVAVTGDGGFGQYMGELTTAVKYAMNITHVLLNNSQLGKITKEQRAAEWDVWQTSLHNPNFSEYARVCGAHGIRVTDAAQLDEAFAAAFAHDGPSLVEVMTDADLI